MKKSIVILSAISLLGLTSCREETFLHTEPSEIVSTPSLKAKVNGLYTLMVVEQPGGTSFHTDFGQKSFDLIMDLLSSDMAMRTNTYNNNSHRAIVEFSATTDNTNLYNYMAWRYYYKMINAANDVIQEIGTPANNDERHYLGQAKAMRAHAYFYLLQLYTKEYDPSAPAIPLYLEPNQAAKPKSTQAEVYAAMVADIEDAVTLLTGFNRTNKGMINEYVARGIAAYIYGAMGNNAKVIQHSDAIISGSGHSVTTNQQAVYYTHGGGSTPTGGGFNDLTTNSWMWGYDITNDNSLDLISWWGSVDIYHYSYAAAGDRKEIDAGLYASMNADDIRRHQFHTTRYNPENKFFNANRVVMGQRNVVDDYVFMRVDEFHLLKAEAQANSGDDTGARATLTNYLTQTQRIGSLGYLSGLSGQNLKDEIYKNTRLEFWGEGRAYLALKRNRKSVTRGSNHRTDAGNTFQYNDNRLYLKIPQSEILNNPHIN